jgi:chromosome transmission fidelity protein 1
VWTLRQVGVLGSADGDGRVLVTRARSPVDAGVKFLLLDASSRFAQVVAQARAVVLAGGTLAPVDDMAQQLFPAGTCVDL